MYIFVIKASLYPKPILDASISSNYNICTLGKSLGSFAFTRIMLYCLKIDE